MLAAATYLENLNPEQRRAVEHGAAGPGPFTPLLVIAGAGSGKTNTLAHRVAHLIVNGADPRKILLMTFSRRAAAEMARKPHGAFAILPVGLRLKHSRIVKHVEAGSVLDFVARACGYA